MITIELQKTIEQLRKTIENYGKRLESENFENKELKKKLAQEQDIRRETIGLEEKIGDVKVNFRD